MIFLKKGKIIDEFNLPNYQINEFIIQILIEMQGKRYFTNVIKQKIEHMIKNNSFEIQRFYEISRLMRKTSIKMLEPHVLRNSKATDIIKWLLLAHHLILSESQHREDQIEELLKMMNPRSEPKKNSFEMMILKKLILPYKMFLFRRNRLNLGQISSENHGYILINLIELALSFLNVLFMLGRYFLNQNKFLIQFSILMAKDLTFLYKMLKTKINEQFSIEHASILQKINEGLFNVFYNCYFYREVSHYAPNWINTEILFAKRSKALNQKSSKPKIQFFGLQNNADEVAESIIIETFESVPQNMDNSEMFLKDEKIESDETIESLQSETNLQRERRQRIQFIIQAQSLLRAYSTPKLLLSERRVELKQQ